MSIYSIRDLEKISGIKAHTIRIWERRYQLIEPKRTSTNIRFYSDEDLKLILNVSMLNQNGLKISKIAKLSSDELKNRVLDLCLDTRNNNVHIESLLVAMIEMDESKFSGVLTNSILKQGFEGTVENILFPFLERVGFLWQAGTINPSQEHFISNLIRQKLIVAIDDEMVNVSSSAEGQTILFFLPEHEWHEIGLLFYSLIARQAGCKVIYLGASVPISDLKDVVETYSVDVLFTSFVGGIEKEKLEGMLTEIGSSLEDVPVYIMGMQIRDLKPQMPAQFKLVSSATEFKKMLS